MDNEIKQKIKTSMEELLKSRGWPETMTNQQIVQSLPELWTKLETEGLLKEFIERGFTYRMFVEIALRTQAKIDAMEHMAQFFRGKR